MDRMGPSWWFCRQGGLVGSNKTPCKYWQEGKCAKGRGEMGWELCVCFFFFFPFVFFGGFTVLSIFLAICSEMVSSEMIGG